MVDQLRVREAAVGSLDRRLAQLGRDTNALAGNDRGYQAKAAVTQAETPILSMEAWGPPAVLP